MNQRRSSGPAAGRDPGRQAHLRLLATSDLHMQIGSHDYHADRATHPGGLARAATRLAALRAAADNSLLFDNGDFLQGNPMGDLIAATMPRTRPHPMMAAMNALGYDAVALGNHEFDYGLPFLGEVLAQAQFPLLAANLAPVHPGGAPAWQPTALLHRVVQMQDGTCAPIRIGVIGLLPPQVTIWNAHRLAGHVTSLDIVHTAQALVPRLKAEGADIIVALAHTGIAAAAPGATLQENAALQLARVAGIDAIFAGHQHLRFPGSDFAGIDGVDGGRGLLHGVPTAMPGAFGSDIGLIDLQLERVDGGWRVSEAAVQLCPIDTPGPAGTPQTLPNPVIISILAPDHEETLAHIRQPLGHSATALHSYFSLLQPAPVVQIVNAAQAWHARRILENGDYPRLPLLSAASPLKAGGRGGPGHYTDIAPGALAIGNVADLYSFPNMLQVVRLSGAQIREWLDMAASLFETVAADGRMVPLLRSGAAPYNFDTIQGLTYRIDLSAPPRYDLDGQLSGQRTSRISELKYMGEDIDLESQFYVATNSFRASGGGNFPGLRAEMSVLTAPDANRDILAAYIAAGQPLHADETANWCFAPTGGALVTVDLGPGAARHLPEIAAFSPCHLGRTDAGFDRYRLTLP